MFSFNGGLFAEPENTDSQYRDVKGGNLRNLLQFPNLGNEGKFDYIFKKLLNYYHRQYGEYRHFLRGTRKGLVLLYVCHLCI